MVVAWRPLEQTNNIFDGRKGRVNIQPQKVSVFIKLGVFFIGGTPMFSNPE